jgi:hypothetical protein
MKASSREEEESSFTLSSPDPDFSWTSAEQTPSDDIQHTYPTAESKLNPNTMDSAYHHHETFYLEDVYFVFDNTIFKFPKAYLSQTSPVLRRLFTNTSAERDIRDDSFTGDGTLANPYSCDTVKKGAFVQVLRLLGPMIFYQMPTLTVEEWKDVLGLSSQWHMDQLVEMAITHLQDMNLDATTKLELARKHNIQNKEWRRSAIRELVDKDMRLTEANAYRIGIDVALKIAKVQGMGRGTVQPQPQPTSFAGFGSLAIGPPHFDDGSDSPHNNAFYSGPGSPRVPTPTRLPPRPPTKPVPTADEYIRLEFSDLYT